MANKANSSYQNRQQKINLLIELAKGNITPSEFKNASVKHPPELLVLHNGIYTLHGTDEKFTKEELKAREVKRDPVLTQVYNKDRK